MPFLAVSLEENNFDLNRTEKNYTQHASQAKFLACIGLFLLDGNGNLPHLPPPQFPAYNQWDYNSQA